MKNFILTILLCCVTVPSFSQSSIEKDGNGSFVKEDWKAINQFRVDSTKYQTANKAPIYSNILNGVKFYAAESICNNEKITKLKLINTNNYPVKVAWQLSIKHTFNFVIVPANDTLQGECFLVNDLKMDDEKSKLLLNLTTDIKRNFISDPLLLNVTVTKVE